MAVYARGYRPYEGEFKLRSPALPIAWEGIRMIMRTWSFKIIGLLTLLMYVVHTIMLYVKLNVTQFFEGQFRDSAAPTDAEFAAWTLEYLHEALFHFYGVGLLFGALITMFAGSGLVADDLRTRALPLYLVRPMRPIDYVFGKALVIPVLLFVILFFPGASFYLLAGLWQPEGNSGTFLWENIGLLAGIFETWLVAAMSYSGIMLFLSARTERRGAVTGLAATIFFVGIVIAELGVHMTGTVGFLLKHLSLISNAMTPLIAFDPAGFGKMSGIPSDRVAELTPSLTVSVLVAIGLLLLGCFTVHRRARTAEVAG